MNNQNTNETAIENSSNSVSSDDTKKPLKAITRYTEMPSAPRYLRETMGPTAAGIEPVVDNYYSKLPPYGTVSREVLKAMMYTKVLGRINDEIMGYTLNKDK